MMIGAGLQAYARRRRPSKGGETVSPSRPGARAQRRPEMSEEPSAVPSGFYGPPMWVVFVSVLIFVVRVAQPVQGGGGVAKKAAGRLGGKHV